MSEEHNNIIDIPGFVNEGGSDEEAAIVQSAFPESVKCLQESLNTIRVNSEAFDELQQLAIQQSMMFSSFKASIPKFYFDIDPIVTGLGKLVVNDALVNKMKAFQDSYSAIVSSYQSPMLKWIQSFDFSPLYESIRKLADYAIDLDKIKDIYLQELFDAHWFPYACWHADLSIFKDILKVIRSTKKSKNRIKKIDKIVFDYYTDNEVEKMKKVWRKLDVPDYFMRILHQAVQAYHRKEYAITVIVLSTQWEGIIYNKVHDSGRKRTKTTKKHLMALIEENDYLEIFHSYFEEFIMYDCHSSDDTIKDVPGRNSAAHSFYNSYPTRKAALNAIIFTDFLLHLQPIAENSANAQEL